MRICIAALTALFLCLGVAHAATPSGSIDKAEAATVIVFGHRDIIPIFMGMPLPSVSQDNMPFCSGALIRTDEKYDLIVTARHCVTHIEDGSAIIDPVPMAVKFNDGKRYRVLWYGYAQKDDIGVLAVEKTGRTPITTDTSGVQRGIDYFVFSMPNGYAWSYTPATSMNGDKYPDTVDPWKQTNLFTCPGCGPGDSGGGIFSESGDLVGITVAGEGSYALAVPARRVLAAVQQVAPR